MVRGSFFDRQASFMGPPRGRRQGFLANFVVRPSQGAHVSFNQSSHPQHLAAGPPHGTFIQQAPDHGTDAIPMEYRRNTDIDSPAK